MNTDELVEFIAEVHEVRTTSSTGGQKGVKPVDYSLIPWDAMAKVAEHYHKGASKYAAHNWRLGYEWSKSFAAMMRHATDFWNGQDFDPETGSHEMDGVPICILNDGRWCERELGHDSPHVLADESSNSGGER